jgi:hypothetical protein
VELYEPERRLFALFDVEHLVHFQRHMHQNSSGKNNLRNTVPTVLES